LTNAGDAMLMRVKILEACELSHAISWNRLVHSGSR